MKTKPDIERKADSLLFVLANKPWTALFLAGIGAGLLLAGALAGAAIGG